MTSRRRPHRVGGGGGRGVKRGVMERWGSNLRFVFTKSVIKVFAAIFDGMKLTFFPIAAPGVISTEVRAHRCCVNHRI